jgi:hypothetical protein
MASLLESKKEACSLASVFFSLLECSPNKKFWPVDNDKSSAKRQATHTRKVSATATFCGGYNYKFSEIKTSVYVPEEPGEFHAQEAAGCHEEGGELNQVLQRRFYT